MSDLTPGCALGSRVVKLRRWPEALAVGGSNAHLSQQM
jgi:hypothetical protein